MEKCTVVQSAPSRYGSMPGNGDGIRASYPCPGASTGLRHPESKIVYFWLFRCLIRRFLRACSEVTLQREESEKPWCLTDNALPCDTPQLAAGRLHFQRALWIFPADTP